MSEKKVAIVGGGCCGLTTIKSCIEAGMKPVCFERTDDICGLWRYTHDVIEGKGSVAKSTIIKTSKEITAFSDFPPPDKFPVFMHHEYVCQYFRLYADHFDLKKYINLNTEVEIITKSKDFADTGKWTVKTRNKITDEVTTEDYDAVVACTGHHAYKHYVKFPGMEDFKGEIVHSHDYRDSSSYHNKTIVVVGVGNSGCDAAAELCKVSPPVYLSTRRGAWIWKNIGANGLPDDMFAISRWRNTVETLFPLWMVNKYKEMEFNRSFDHVTYSIKPEHHVTGQHPTINDDIPIRIASGTIMVKPNIKRMTKTGIEFDDGSVLENVDVLILATGYDYGFPYIDKSVLDIKENRLDFYMYAFLPDLEKQTMAFIGCVQPTGPIMPIAELQSRLAMQVFKGERKLPSKEKMWMDINNRRDRMKKRYVNTQRHTIQVDYVSFLDELATMIGCKPNIGQIFLTDPVFAYKMYFGPCTSYSYRLVGPNSWDGAKKAIETQWDRVEAATKVKDYKESDASWIYYVAVVILFLAVVVVFFWK